MARVVGIGAGGHAKVVIEILRSQGIHEIVGLLDSRRERKGQLVLGVPILGDDAILAELIGEGVRHFFVGVGTVGDTTARREIYERARSYGLDPVDAVHRWSVVSPSASIGRGVTIMPGAIVNAMAQLGENVIINSGAIVEHDCIIGDHVHVATGARLASTVNVGMGTHIGAGATVRQLVRIGDRAVVGAGAVVVENVRAGALVLGVPARERTPQAGA